METLGAASELDAVNEMLAAIGEDPVEAIDNLPPSGHTALSVLRSTSRAFQEDGHWFNSETDYTLAHDPSTGFVPIPDAILFADAVDGDLIQRGQRLYDRENQTFVIGKDVNCEVVIHLFWSELPSVARRYVTALATETFVDGIPGAQGASEARQRNLIRARAAFARAELKAEDLNLLTNTTIAGLLRRS